MSLSISRLTDLNGLPCHVDANSSQGLICYTFGEGLFTFFSYFLDQPLSYRMSGPSQKKGPNPFDQI